MIGNYSCGATARRTGKEGLRWRMFWISAGILAEVMTMLAWAGGVAAG